MNVASQCMNVLVIGVNTRLDVGLQEMLRVRTGKESREQQAPDALP